MALAIHHGHDLRDDVARIMVLDEESRLREEDPYTGFFTDIVENRVVVYRSRFEVDLNRPRNKAVYILPEDAWGLTIWQERPPKKIITRSRKEYDRFYSDIYMLCSRLKERYGHFVVLDIHSYNHRRESAHASPADPGENPEINIGTGTMDRDRWGGLVERFMADLRGYDYFGRRLDVRENVKFRGGNLVRYIHQEFPESGCAIAIEFKKFFMDEWTGVPDEYQLDRLKEALRSTIAGIIEELGLIGE